MSFADQGFKQIGSEKGKWEVVYGGITENVKYISNLSINSANTIGYAKIDRADGVIIHMFISKFDGEKEIITTTGVSDGVFDISGVHMNSIDPKKDLEEHFNKHLESFGAKSPISDSKYLEKQLKKIPDRVYELVKRIYLQKMGL